MKSAVVFAIFFGLVGVVRGQSTNVQACVYQGNVDTLPINTYIVGCDEVPCTFARNTTVEMQMVFKAPRRIMSLRTAALAYILGPISTEYPLGDEEFACNFLTNTYCPLLENEVVQYTLRMDIENWMPTISVTIEFVVRDYSDSSTVACIRLPIIVTPATTYDPKIGAHTCSQLQRNTDPL